MGKPLDQAVAGDWVWACDMNKRRVAVIKVKSVGHQLSMTFIGVADGAVYGPKPPFPLHQRGSGPNYPFLGGVATAEEAAAWEAEQEELRRKERERVATRQELGELFGGDAVVGEGDGRRPGAWMVTLYGSADGLKRWAELLKE